MTVNKEIRNNAIAISLEIKWLVLFISNRLEAYFDSNKIFEAPDAPNLNFCESKYSESVSYTHLTLPTN